MASRITKTQRESVLRMLAEGLDRYTIATSAGLTPGQVSAIAAHVKMGTYSLPSVPEATESESILEQTEKSKNMLRELHKPGTSSAAEKRVTSVLLGFDVGNNDEVFWNPDPDSGSVNPHVLVLGESGFGKTYTIACLLAELARQKIISVVFDYGQGFSVGSLPQEFVDTTHPVEIQASRDGIDINPLQIFPSDVLGPINVAQRIADTFARVYPRIGVQQHAILRDAVLDVMSDAEIRTDNARSWQRELPNFGDIHRKLLAYANNPLHPQSRLAASVASHISTLFVFNTFRPTGIKFNWREIISGDSPVLVIQLKGLEYSLERAVTELLLWNLIGYIEALGPSPIRCFIVLDEAHKLSFAQGSPVEKLLREGRKFGLGLILASQQPEDFSAVAFGNTATKIIFQVGDEKSTISRQLYRKISNAPSFVDIYQVITKLPRGCAYVVSENLGHVVRIASFSERA